MNYNFIIEKLTDLLIKQDFKDKKTGKKECISKVTAYNDLIKFFKEVKENEKSNSDSDAAIDSITYSTIKNLY